MCLLLTLPASAQQANQAGSITALKPRDFLTRGQQAPLEARKGDPVYWQDIIETERGGRVRVGLLDGSILNMGSEARVQILSHDATTQQSDLLLNFGKMRILVRDISRPGGKFEVRTETAVLGVIGTDEFIDASNPGRTCATSLAGIVSLRSDDPTIPGIEFLFPGETSCVEEGKPPEPKRPAPPEVFQDAFSSTSLTPEVSLSPASAPQGSVVEAEITDENLLPIESLTVGGTGVSVAVLEGATPTRIPVQIAVAEDAPLGALTITLQTPQGEAGVEFLVTPRPGFDLHVAPPASPDFPLEVNPSSSSRSVQVLLVALGGFSESVELSFAGLPEGVTPLLGSTSLSPGAPVELSFAAAPTAVPGDYEILLQGTGAGLLASIDLYVRVLAPPAPPGVPQIQVHGEHFFNPTEPPEILTDTEWSILQGGLLVLDASESSVPGGRVVDFQWQILNTRFQGDAARFEIDTWELPPGTYRIQLQVSGERGATASREFRLTVQPVPNPDEVLFGLRQAYETLQINQYLSYFDPIRFRGYPTLEESIRNSFQELSEARVYLRIDNRQVLRDDAYYQAAFEVEFRTRDNPELARRRVESQTLRLLLIRSANPGAVWKIVDYSVTVSEIPGEPILATLVLSTDPPTSESNPLELGLGETTELHLTVSSSTVTGLVNLTAAPPPGVTISFGASQVPLNSTTDVFLTAEAAAAGPSQVLIIGQTSSVGGSVPIFLTLAARPALPILSVSPTSLNFGSVLVGTTSTPQSVTISNSGTADLLVNSINLSGSPAFLLTLPSLPATLSPGGSMSFDVEFVPLQLGPASAAVTIASNTGSAQVAVSGTGTAPAISVNTTSINFGNVLVGQTSPAATVTVSNSGTATLTVNSITLSGPGSTAFALTLPTLPASISPSGTLTFSAAFTPSAALPFAATLTVASNAGSPTVSLSGTGVSAAVPVLSVNPTSVDFGDVVVGTTSPAQIVTVSNTGTADLVITSVTLSGSTAFSLPSSPMINPPVTVPASGSVQIDLFFTPSDLGPASATLAIDSNDPASPLTTIPLAGTGLSPEITVSTQNLDFGSVPVNTTSLPQSFSISNTGNADLIVNSITVDNPVFAATPALTLPATLVPSASMNVQVTFAPSALGLASGTLQIFSNDPGSPLPVALTGNGISGATPVLSVNPTSVNFGDVIVGSTSAPISVTVMNAGTADLVVNSVTFAGSTAFGLSAPLPNFPVVLPPGTSFNIDHTFSPSITGLATGTMTVSSNAGSVDVPFSGNGISGVPQISVSPTSLNFPTVPEGTSSILDLTISNVGTADLTITSIDESNFCDGPFCESDSAIIYPKIFPPGSGIIVPVTYQPFSAPSSDSSSIGINSDDPATPFLSVPLTGSSVVAFTVSPVFHDFTLVTVGMSSSPLTVTITNTSGTPLAVNSISAFSNPTVFAVSSSAPTTLSPGASMTFTVTFAPSALGVTSDVIQVSTNFITKTVGVRGEGGTLATGFTVTTCPFDFGTPTLGGSSGPATFIITNLNPLASLTVTSVTSTNFQFTVTGAPTTVPAGGTATFTVTYTAFVVGRTEAAIRTETPLGVEYCEVIGTGVSAFRIAQGSGAGDSGKRAPAGPVDLAVRQGEIRQEPRRIRPGEPVQFRAPVHNLGPAAARGVVVEFSIPRLGAQQRETVDLEAGETVVLLFETQFERSDFGRRLRPRISVDPDRQLPDEQRRNNIAVLPPLELAGGAGGAGGGHPARPQRAHLVVAPGDCVGFRFRGGQTACGRDADIELSIAADGSTPVLRAAGVQALDAVSFEQLGRVPEEFRGSELPLEPGRMLAVQPRSGAPVVLRVVNIRRSSAIRAPGTGRPRQADAPRTRRFPGEPADLPAAGPSSGVLPLIQVVIEWAGGR